MKLDYRLKLNYPHGVVNLNRLGEFLIQKRIKRNWIWDKWETVEVIKQVEPSVDVSMGYNDAIDSYCKYLKFRSFSSRTCLLYSS